MRRFGLKTIFVLILLVSIALGGFAHRVKRANQQRLVVKRFSAPTSEFGQADAVMAYDFQLTGKSQGYFERFGFRDADEARMPNVPKWLVDQLGVDFFGSITDLTIKRGSVGDYFALTSLGNIQYLSAQSAEELEIEDLDFLGNCKQLAILRVAGNPISDLKPLRSKPLTHLFIGGTNVTSLKPIEQAKGLRFLYCSSAPIADFKPLAEMRNLEILLAEKTHVKDFKPLANLTSLKELRLSELGESTTRHLSGLINLTSLCIDGGDLNSGHGVSLDFLRGLERLEELQLYNVGGRDLSALSGLKKLRKLALSSQTVVDISDLRNLPKLENLYLDCPNVGAIPDLTSASGLVRLTLDTPGVINWSEITKLTNLHCLEILQAPKLSKLNLKQFFRLESLQIKNSPLQQIDFGPSQFEAIDLEKCNIREISGLKNMVSLKRLCLSKTKVEDFSPIKSLPNLENLALVGTSIKDLRLVPKLRGEFTSLNLDGTLATDLAPLVNHAFETLSLEGMDIDDFSFLAKVYVEYRLDLSRTGIENLSPLAKHLQLEELSLNGTKVRDLSPLYGMKKLRHVSLRGTLVSLEEIKKLEAALPDCWVEIDEASRKAINALEPMEPKEGSK